MTSHIWRRILWRQINIPWEDIPLQFIRITNTVIIFVCLAIEVIEEGLIWLAIYIRWKSDRILAVPVVAFHSSYSFAVSFIFYSVHRFNKFLFYIVYFLLLILLCLAVTMVKRCCIHGCVRKKEQKLASILERPAQWIHQRFSMVSKRFSLLCAQQQNHLQNT